MVRLKVGYKILMGFLGLIMISTAFTGLFFLYQENILNVRTLIVEETDHPTPLSVDPLLPNSPVVTTVDNDLDTRAAGGTLKWKYSTPEGEPISSPALADLNGDGTLEVVFASAGDAIYALEPNGAPFWSTPYTDDVIDYLGQTSETSGLDFDPPPIFSSVTPADVDLGPDKELIVGVQNGALCLQPNGDQYWKKGLTTGYYFSTCGVTDLEGQWDGTKDSLEIIMASDDTSRAGWLEAFESDGGSVFREEVTCGGEGGLIGCSVACNDLDGSFNDGREPDPETEEVDTELVVGNHDKGMRIWKRAGNQQNGKPNYDETTSGMLAGHQTYATPAVGNFTGGPASEIITASCEGYQRTWEGWGGKVYCYDPSGNLLWDFSTGSSRAGIISSPSVGDVQVAKNDPSEKELDYEIFVGCDNGKLYCLDADYHSEIWSFDTGGRVMSSPAICNIDSDDELEVCIGSGSGTVYMMDGDPSDGVDDGQSVAGDSLLHDCLWEYKTGVDTGISSPMVADIDLDGHLDVVIGDIEGNIYAIEAGGKCIKGQKDWVMFHYDLNKTGFYNPQVSFGVDLSPQMISEDPLMFEQLIKDVRPGETVTYNLTIVNTGKGVTAQAKDVIYLSVDGVPSTWNARIDTPPDQGDPNPDYVRLASQEMTNVTLYVTAPWEGDIGELARINVTANSSNDPWATDSVTTLSVLDVYLDFEMEYLMEVDNDIASDYSGEKWDKISPGGEYLVGISVRNTGNLNDSYSLSLSGMPSGWSAIFVESGTSEEVVKLDADIFESIGGIPTASLSMKVTCPFDAIKGEEARIKLAAVSNMSYESSVELLERSDEVIFVAGETNDIDVSCEDSQRFISPNGTTRFTVNVHYGGNKDSVNVEMFYDGLLDGWDIRLLEGEIQKSDIKLYMDQTKKITVEVHAPDNAPADLTLVMTFSARIKEETHISDSVGLTAVVRHVYDFNTKISPTVITVNPGETLDFSIECRNTGNGKDMLTPSAYDINLGWNLTFLQDGFAITSLDLFYKGWANFSMGLEIPLNTLADTYNVGINISGLGEPRDPIYLKVIVNQTYDLKVLTYPELSNKTTKEMFPMQTSTFIFEVRNDANGPETVILSIEDIPTNWNAYFGAVANTPDYTSNVQHKDFSEPMNVTNIGPDVIYYTKMNVREDTLNISLPTGHRCWVTLYLTSPEGASKGDVKQINLLGKSSGREMFMVDSNKDGIDDDNLASIMVSILLPELVFEGRIQVTGALEVGKLTTISVNIKNVGDIEANNVMVTLYIKEPSGDYKEVKSVIVKRIFSDKEQLVTFTWKPSQFGVHDIKIVIDPSNTVKEINDNNNEITTTKTISGAGTVITDVATNPMTCSIFLLLLILAAVATAFVVMKKKGMV